jgi:hypothetical protein
MRRSNFELTKIKVMKSKIHQHLSASRIRIGKTIYFTVLLALMGCAAAKAQYTVTLNPVQDAYFISMGGGQGANTMMKFNISSLPSMAVISSAKLKVYVWDTTGPGGFAPPTVALGNMRFMRLSGHQNWLETDSAYKYALNQNTYSDTVTQTTGFGDSIGWATSANLRNLVQRDLDSANTFNTLLLKDPDDVTCCSAIGPNFTPYLANSNDSLITGNKMVGVDQIMFYPSEASNPNYKPVLTINYTCQVSSTQSLTICSYDSVVVGSHTYRTTGTYVDTLANASHTCDSIVTTSLTVKPALDLSVTVNGNSITSNEVGATYQWIDCSNNNSALGGEAGQTLNVMTSGNYAVVVTKNGCSDTSACQNIIFMNVKNNNLFARIYPNPVKDVLYVEIEKGNVEIALCDLSGRVIYRTSSTGKVVIDMKNENKGLYLLKATGDNESKVIKVVKD